MAFADASLVSLRDIKEATFGVTPTTGQWKERRLVSEDLGQNKEIVASDEIVNDRTTPDNIQVGSSASGPVTSELTGGNGATDTWDDYVLASLNATGYSTKQGFLHGGGGLAFTAGTITPANSGTNDITLTLSGATPANWPAAFIPGELIYIAGFTGVRATLNTVYKIKANATTVLTLTGSVRVPSTPGTEAATNLDALQLGSATNGSSFWSFSQERKYAPMTTDFALLDGMVLTGFDIDAQPKKPARITWNFLGKEELSAATTAVVTGVTGAITSRKSFTLASDFRALSINDDGHSYFLNGFKLSVKNGAYLQDERAGTIGPIGIGFGTFSVTGSFDGYYDSASGVGSAQLFTNYHDFVDQEILFSIGNIFGDAMCFHLPRCNYNDARRSTPGKAQPHKPRMDFIAARGSTFPYQIKVARL